MTDGTKTTNRVSVIFASGISELVHQGRFMWPKIINFSQIQIPSFQKRGFTFTLACEFISEVGQSPMSSKMAF